MKRMGRPTLLGIPFDAYSSYLRGTGDAPGKIREALACDASNSWSELGVDLSVAGVYEDAGDLTFTEKDAFSVIEAGVGALIDAGKRPVLLGGDHSITFPIVKAVGRQHPGLTIFHFDAHPDLYEEFEGNRLSHACPFARIMEAGLAKRLVQIGIRTLNRHQREQAEKFGVEVVEMRGLPAYRNSKRPGRRISPLTWMCWIRGLRRGYRTASLVESRYGRRLRTCMRLRERSWERTWWNTTRCGMSGD